VPVSVQLFSCHCIGYLSWGHFLHYVTGIGERLNGIISCASYEFQAVFFCLSA